MYLYKYTTAEAFSKIIEYGTLKVINTKLASRMVCK